MNYGTPQQQESILAKKTNTEYVREIRARETTEKREARKLKNRDRMAALRAAQGSGDGKPGAPALREGDKTHPRTITLPGSYWEIASEIGDGVYSAGIRIAIEEAQKLRDKAARRKASK